MLFVLALIVFACRRIGDRAHAQFYKGKTITMIVNYPAGGPTDLEGRIVALHLPAHIPGNPTIVVKNVGGAGGLIGSNQLGEAAPNGESIGFFTLDVPGQLIGNSSLKTRYSDFVLVAGVESPLVVYMRKDTPPGIKVAADLMKAQEFKALSLNAQNTNTLNQALALDLLGVKYQAIPAYRGLKEVETAILQNIGQMANSSLSGWSGSVEPTMGHVVMPMWQMSPRQERRLPAQQGAAQPADVRGILRSGSSRQAARREFHLQDAARDFRSAACDVPRDDDAAEVLRRGRLNHARSLRRDVEEPAVPRRLFQGHQDRADPGHRRRGPGGAERAGHGVERDEGVSRQIHRQHDQQIAEPRGWLANYRTFSTNLPLK